jgi:Cof subfamily protein (haloacid dehalogenase superfamily)
MRAIIASAHKAEGSVLTQLFASDLDGTLLNPLHVTDRTIVRAVRATIASGRHFAIATGRFMRSGKAIGFGELPVEVVCANGALVFGQSGQLLRSMPLDSLFVEELLRSFPTIGFDFIGTQHIYTRLSAAQRVAQLRAPNLLARIVMRGMTTDADDVWITDQSAAQILSHDIVKVNCRISDEGAKADLSTFLYERRDSVVNAPFNPSMFEITSVGVDKGAAVAWLAGSLGIPVEDVVVYGDGGNDVAMLRLFSSLGRSYATHGACEQAKLAASSTIGSNVVHAVPRHVMSILCAEGPICGE